MQGFTYPVILTPDKSAGGYVVTCRDVPEVVTQGESLAHALDEASGALQAAIEMRIEDGIDIPLPSAKKRREHMVALPVSTAMKAALYSTMRERSITKSDNVLGKRVEILVA
jgi:antitoxin HicB